MFEFFKKAFKDIRDSARAQHEVDRANFAAERAEARKRYREAKLMRKRETRMVLEAERREQAIREANERRLAAEEELRHFSEIEASAEA